MSDITLDPRGLAQVANTIGGSIVIGPDDAAPETSGCGSQGVATVLSMFSDAHASVHRAAGIGTSQTGIDVLASANDFSATDESYAATFAQVFGQN